MRLMLSLVCAFTLMWTPPALGQQQAVRGWRFTLAERDSIAASQQTRQQRTRRRRSAGSSNVGYIDNAIVGNQLQIRYDFLSGINRADRAEFIYAKCGCFREVGLDPNAPGPTVPLMGRDPATTPFIETGLDIHDIVVDVEYAFGESFSVFAEVPFRILRPEVIASASGFGDARVGLKAAAVAEDNRHVTFQLSVYIPFGDALEGLGTNHASVEPALLYHERVADRFTIESELRFWIPVDGSTALGVPGATATDDFHGGVIRYGVGFGYDASPESTVRITPVVEFVGWTVTSGHATGTTDGTAATVTFEDANATIVNVKVGIRIGVREADAIFVGYGEALTNDVWYERVLRAEYRLVF